MKITAADVNQLRKQSGAGMMDCKKALQEANGNMEEAILILRKKGQKISAKRADRDANEGVVIARTANDSKYGIVVALNCETDFVAKNDDFKALAEEIATVAMNNKPQDLAALKALNLSDNRAISDNLLDYTGKIGEKIDLSTYKLIEGETVVPYIHSNSKLGVLVELNKAGENIETAGKDVAMQIAAMNPVALNKDEVSEEVIAREIELGKEKAIQEGKPANIAEKIAQGMLAKFYKDNTLLEQAFIKDGSLTISKMLDGVEKGLTVNSFERVTLS